jgi:hypothetical protein
LCTFSLIIAAFIFCCMSFGFLVTSFICSIFGICRLTLLLSYPLIVLCGIPFLYFPSLFL